MITTNHPTDNNSLVDVIAFYEKVAQKENIDSSVYEKLGDSYYFKAHYKKAIYWYSHLFSDTNYENTEIIYRYAQSLKFTGNYKKAESYFEWFSQLVPEDMRANPNTENENYLDRIAKNSNRATLNGINTNSNTDTFGGFVHNSDFIFTSKDHQNSNNNRTKTLYQAQFDSIGVLSTITPLLEKNNTTYNESSAVITKDGKTLYFCANDKKTKEGNEVVLKIYRAIYNGKKWTKIQELPFNSDSYNCAHPALSPDEQTLYFASDMPGGYGSSDIYKVSINPNKIFGKPENLGKNINTYARETFPFISANNILYFASDGHLGLGKLDIFAVKTKNLQSGEIINIGKPFNSEYDDFAFSNYDTIGFVSSNRNKADKIYSFKENVPLVLSCNNTLIGTITEANSYAVVYKAQVLLLDEKMNEIDQTTSNSDGTYLFKNINCANKYFIRVLTDNYLPYENALFSLSQKGDAIYDIRLAPLVISVQDFAKNYATENIYFAVNQWQITDKAEKQLNILLTLLEEYPWLNITIKSHCDSRASNDYNMLLSSKRAQATINWLLKKGISRSRLSGKGYGETLLINQCSNAVRCSEAEHQANRRSEFTIID
ncbi:OmpA family protein [Flavobacterium chuncheonense]|uniref:OmpA family protein n=1 Tax=Flavobacterium chuncheonense TaxID=2026653 RepID=A0ABW5YI87_9FLAO